MSSTVVRIAFAFFVLACIGTAAWTSEDEAPAPTEQLISETWIPVICSVWSDYHEEARERAVAARAEQAEQGEVCNAAACSSGYTAQEGDFRRSEAAGPSEAPYRR